MGVTVTRDGRPLGLEEEVGPDMVEGVLKRGVLRALPSLGEAAGAVLEACPIFSIPVNSVRHLSYKCFICIFSVEPFTEHSVLANNVTQTSKPAQDACTQGSVGLSVKHELTLFFQGTDNNSGLLLSLFHFFPWPASP